jgi:hypothetical protein
MATRPKKNNDAALTYEVLSPLEHDQVLYVPGEMVALTSDVAQPLLDCRVIAPAPVAA